MILFCVFAIMWTVIVLLYIRNTLHQFSVIDHVFVNNDLIISNASDYRAVLDATNLSDHLPIYSFVS